MRRILEVCLWTSLLLTQGAEATTTASTTTTTAKAADLSTCVRPYVPSSSFPATNEKIKVVGGVPRLRSNNGKVTVEDSAGGRCDFAGLSSMDPREIIKLRHPVIFRNDVLTSKWAAFKESSRWTPASVSKKLEKFLITGIKTQRTSGLFHNRDYVRRLDYGKRDGYGFSPPGEEGEHHPSSNYEVEGHASDLLLQDERDEAQYLKAVEANKHKSKGERDPTLGNRFWYVNDDAYNFPEAFVNDITPNKPLYTMCRDDELSNVWMGSKGVIASQHFDTAENFLVQITGRKRFYFWPPENSRFFYPFPGIHLHHRHSMVDIYDEELEAKKEERDRMEVEFDLLNAPPSVRDGSLTKLDGETKEDMWGPVNHVDVNRARFPHYYDHWNETRTTRAGRSWAGGAIVADLSPGDIMYIPPYWWHRVEALDTSVSVSHFCSSAEDFLLDAVYEKPPDFLLGLDSTDDTIFHAGLTGVLTLIRVLAYEVNKVMFEHDPLRALSADMPWQAFFQAQDKHYHFPKPTAKQAAGDFSDKQESHVTVAMLADVFFQYLYDTTYLPLFPFPLMHLTADQLAYNCGQQDENGEENGVGIATEHGREKTIPSLYLRNSTPADHGWPRRHPNGKGQKQVDDAAEASSLAAAEKFVKGMLPAWKSLLTSEARTGRSEPDLMYLVLGMYVEILFAAMSPTSRQTHHPAKGGLLATSSLMLQCLRIQYAKTGPGIP